jgi:hypothetical protein
MFGSLRYNFGLGTSGLLLKMTYVKRIICLANSRKISGRCVAGKEIIGNGFGGWIRPVSSRPTGELSEYDRRYQNGTDPKLLDVIDIQMTKHTPHGFQTENHQIDDGAYWSLVRTSTPAELAGALDDVPGVLWNNHSSSSNGLRDRVSEAIAAQLQDSLLLIDVSKLTISVAVEGAAFNNAKRKVRGSFVFNDVPYMLSVTDPIVEREYLKRPDGEYDGGPATLCVSLGDIWQGYAYKLIAGVFFPP